MLVWLTIYMDASQSARNLCFDGQAGCGFISGLLAVDMSLLAPMEFADSLLI
jgi:hypothetical protein